MKQLVDILDADGDGVIEYDEWRKVAGKATSILKPAIILQTYLQVRCFGESFWSREKTRIITEIQKQNYPNILQFYKKEVLMKKPDAEEVKAASKWLGEEVSLDVHTGKEEYEDVNAGSLNLKGVLKAKMLAKGVQEKVARQRDPTKHGFTNPFRNAKVGNYGAVKMGDFNEDEFYYEDEEFGKDGPTPEQVRECVGSEGHRRVSLTPARRRSSRCKFGRQRQTPPRRIRRVGSDIPTAARWWTL